MDTKLAKASHVSQILSCLFAAATFAIIVWPLVRPEQQAPTSYLKGFVGMYWPLVPLALCILGAAVLNFAAAVKARKNAPPDPAHKGIDAVTHKHTVDKLNECESLLKHWKDEVERVRLDLNSRLETANTQWKEAAGEVSNLHQKLRVCQDRADNLREQLSTPKGWVKLKKVRYIATQAPANTSKLPEKDLTQLFEDKYLEDGKLIIPLGLYRKLFGVQNDPYLGVEKLLEIQFVHAGTAFSVLVPENISMTLPFPYAVTSERVT